MDRSEIRVAMDAPIIVMSANLRARKLHPASGADLHTGVVNLAGNCCSALRSAEARRYLLAKCYESDSMCGSHENEINNAIMSESFEMELRLFEDNDATGLKLFFQNHKVKYVQET